MTMGRSSRHIHGWLQVYLVAWSKSCADATGDSWQSSLTHTHTLHAILYPKKEWICNSTIYRDTSTHSILLGGDGALFGTKGINWCAICSVAANVPPTSYWTCYKHKVCWMSSFGSLLLQHNVNHLRYVAVLLFSPVSTACKSCKTEKKERGWSRKKTSAKDWTWRVQESEGDITNKWLLCS